MRWLAARCRVAVWAFGAAVEEQAGGDSCQWVDRRSR